MRARGDDANCSRRWSHIRLHGRLFPRFPLSRSHLAAANLLVLQHGGEVERVVLGPRHRVHVHDTRHTARRHEGGGRGLTLNQFRKETVARQGELQLHKRGRG